VLAAQRGRRPVPRREPSLGAPNLEVGYVYPPTTTAGAE